MANQKKFLEISIAVGGLGLILAVIGEATDYWKTVGVADLSMGFGLFACKDYGECSDWESKRFFLLNLMLRGLLRKFRNI